MGLVDFFRESFQAKKAAEAAAREQDMGLFDFIKPFIGPVAAAFGGPAAGVAATALFATPAAAPIATRPGAPSFIGPLPVQAGTSASGLRVSGGKVFAGPQASADPQLRNNRLAALSADTSSGGISGGNGATATRTLIQTVDIATGLITALDIRPGSPFLMNNDVRKIRGLSKKLLRAAGKVPRRTAKTSPQKQLTNAVIQRTLSTVLTGDAHHPHCP